SANWATPGNWDIGNVPAAVDDILIPNTSNKPLLDQARTINSLNISQGGAVLDLNNFNLTVSTYVTLVGTLTARGAEQITVGGNWNATGGWYNTAQSTVVFNTSTSSSQTITNGNLPFGNVEVKAGT